MSWRPRGRILSTGLGVLLALATFGGEASAQSWTHAELVDHDQEAEDFSLFWESALASDLQGYIKLVRHARTLWGIRGRAQRKSALDGLRTAASTHPEKPEAHFWLGQFLYEDQKWQACADALETVYAMEPGFVPEGNRVRRGLDESLAGCLLYAGHYEGAIEHYKRIITLDAPTVRTQQLLGEALMALGRLNEAIDFLRLASKGRGRIDARFVLGVALDRAERITEARAILAEARDRDRDLAALKSADRIYAPAEDEHYYLGLAYAVKTRRSRAHKALSLYHFRRYLKLAPNSPWRKRAEQHRDAIGVPPFADDLQVQGSVRWDLDKLRESLQRVAGPVRACLSGHPGLLIRLDLSALASPAAPLQIRATTVLATDVERVLRTAALECAEKAARSVVAPPLTISPGRHASAHFSVLGAP